MLNLTACFPGPSFYQQQDNPEAVALKTLTDAATGAEVASLKANFTVAQEMKAPDSSVLAGTAVLFPPGSLAVDTNISIEEAVPVAVMSTAAELGIGDKIKNSGVSIAIQSTAKVDAAQPFTLSIEIPSGGGLRLTDDLANLVVIYKASVAADNRTVAGIIPRNEISITGSKASFSTRYFGVYQTAMLTEPAVGKKEVPVETPILTKQMVAALPPIAVAGRAPFVVGANRRIEISGANFRQTMVVALGGQKVSGLTVASDVKASFVAPDYKGFGLTKVSVEQDGVAQTISVFYLGNATDLPVITLSEAEVCKGQKYYDAGGDVHTGSKSCEGPDLSNLKAENIRSGVTIAGITGIVRPSPAACSTDGELFCMTTASFPAVSTKGLAEKVVAGESAAGVKGSYAPISYPVCANDGESSCIASTPFKAALTKNLASKVVSGQTVAGIQGTAAAESHSDCAADGSIGCVATTAYTAAMTSGLAAKILSGQSVAGVAGTTIGESHNDCTSDGGLACVTTANYKAAAISGLSSKIVAGYSVAGVTGTAAGEAHSNCTVDGGTNCVATVDYAATATQGLAGKIITGSTVAGIAGTAIVETHANCSSNGSQSCVATGAYYAAASCAADSSNCYVPSYAASTQPLKAISYDAIDAGKGSIRTSLTLSGIAGTLAECSGNALTGCVTTATFKSADLTNVVPANIKRGVSVAGITGNFPSSSSPLPRYMDANSQTTGGIDEPDLTNFITQMTSGGTFEYWDSFGVRRTGSGDPNINSSNVKSGITFANLSVTGTYAGAANCTGDGQTACVTTSIYKSLDTTALTPWDIRKGKFAGGIAGNLSFYKNMVNTGVFDRLTGTAAVSGPDVYDTIDDYNNNGSFPTQAPAGWDLPTGANWTPVVAGIAVKDEITGLLWQADQGTAVILETAITQCENSTTGSRSDWRVPTQKELLQAYTDGIWSQKTSLALQGTTYWSATTLSNNTASTSSINLFNGQAVTTTKASTMRVICVAP